MLVLHRKLGQTILIADDIAITILSAKGSLGVKVGITAPRDIAIDRAEVRKRKDGARAMRCVRSR
jgi:carbon storage regulator